MGKVLGSQQQFQESDLRGTAYQQIGFSSARGAGIYSCEIPEAETQ